MIDLEGSEVGREDAELQSEAGMTKGKGRGGREVGGVKGRSATSAPSSIESGGTQVAAQAACARGARTVERAQRAGASTPEARDTAGSTETAGLSPTYTVLLRPGDPSISVPLGRRRAEEAGQHLEPVGFFR